MKKLLILITAGLMTSSVYAGDHYRRYEPYHNHHRPHGHYNWVAPALISGMIGYGIARSMQPPVVVPPPPVVTYGPALPPPGFRWAELYDSACNCQRMVLIQN